ncbi:MAG: HEPN domain-containing protein [Defluviitaleaceae bacterium]|nr:HEPN domain-containing protein [Defluviitaleaceae bacterium]
MSDYRSIAQLDLEDAEFCFANGRYRLAVFHFQQFAEKSAKALLEKKDPGHKQLKSHVVESILEAYDETHATSEIGDKARYLTGFYFNTRYPGDNYTKISEARAKRAKQFSADLDVYFKAELDALTIISNGTTLKIDSLPLLDLL